MSFHHNLFIATKAMHLNLQIYKGLPKKNDVLGSHSTLLHFCHLKAFLLKSLYSILIIHTGKEEQVVKLNWRFHFSWDIQVSVVVGWNKILELWQVTLKRIFFSFEPATFNLSQSSELLWWVKSKKKSSLSSSIYFI